MDDVGFDFQKEFDEIPEVVEGFLTTSGDEAARHALAQVDITDDGIFDIVNTRAIDYAKNRSAEMVGRKYVDGKLVDNPDAKWVITEPTRDSLRTLVEKAYEDGTTPAELANQIAESNVFSDSRAKLIAKTEMSTASINGTLTGWRESGVVVGKSSLLSGDHDEPDECDDNAEDGVIGIDDLFSSGDDGPPYHPGCDCALVAEVDDGKGNSEEDEED